MAVTINGTTGITLPTTAAPTFFAYLNSNQTGISSNTSTKIQLANTLFDTNSNFNISTYRWTPTIAGYYEVNAITQADYTGSPMSNHGIQIYKNGTLYIQGRTQSNWGADSANFVIYMNGTDYLELYVLLSGGSGLQVNGYTNGTVYATWMSAAFIRS